MSRIAIVLATLLAFATAFPALPAGAAAEMPLVDFEDGTAQGFSGRGGSEKLTVTSDEAHSGSNSLLVANRSASWHGPALNVGSYVESGHSYDVSVWVLPKTPAQSHFRLSTQIGDGGSATYAHIADRTVKHADGWTELKGTFIYVTDAKYITIYVENDTADAEYYIDDVSFAKKSEDGLAASSQLPSLHETYADYFLIGSATGAGDLAGPRFELVRRHFNVLTFGNDMKPDALGGRTKGAYNFTGADAMIKTLDEAGISVVGHTLVWHSQSAAWLNKNADGSALTRAEAKANLEDYITKVAGHYAGCVISWDVVNEAFQTYFGETFDDWRDVLRKGGSSHEDSAWYAAYANGAADGESGADYIYDAFVYARLADPGAVLYYNDFNEESPGKRKAIALMTEELNDLWRSDPRNTEPDRLLIEGLGMQAHYWTSNLNPADVETTIVCWIETGAEISVTELDIPAGSWSAYRALDEAEERKQAKLYAELFLLYMKYSDSIERVSIWGVDDPTSWRSQGNPLLFDANGEAKLAFYAVLDPSGYLAGEYDDVKSWPDDSGSSPAPAPPAAEETAAPPADEVSPPLDDSAAVADGGTGDSDPERSANPLPIILAFAAAIAVLAIVYAIMKKRRRV